MDFDSFSLLLTEKGQAALRAAEALQPVEKDYLVHFQSLCRTYPEELAQAALETAIFRQEAVVKFDQAGVMYFTRQALEQASSSEVARQRAVRYARLSRAIDLGCSIGGDALALAEKTFVVGIDLDPLRLQMARANLESLGLGSQAEFLRADLNQSLPLPRRIGDQTGLFFDPARRAGGRRMVSVQDYLPPLPQIFTWLPDFPALGVKISPGVRQDELREYPAEIEFVSLHGDLKEAALWFGPLKTATRRATILPGGFSLAEEHQPEVAISAPPRLVLRA